MENNSAPPPICLQWRIANGERNDDWNTYTISGVPVARRVKIRITAVNKGLTGEITKLVERIQEIVQRVHGTFVDERPQPLIACNPKEESLLEVLVWDGTTAVVLEKRLEDALRSSHNEHVWVLPIAPTGCNPTQLPGDLPKQNVAFWKVSIAGLAFTVLGRAGVTSLDRRVFISYRRVETQPMAGQLFDALSQLNYNVFLDTVSVDPGIDFQARLFEQLADKSMIVLLHSETFSKSIWTMAEIEYARKHDLSVLIYRLPKVDDKDALIAQYRGGEAFELKDPFAVAIVAANAAAKAATDAAKAATDAITAVTDAAAAAAAEAANAAAKAAAKAADAAAAVDRHTDVTADAQGRWHLTESALARILDQIAEFHDEEMIRRLAKLRRGTFAALERHGLNASEQGASAYVESGGNTWSLVPVARPPGVPELYDANCLPQTAGKSRVVVGNVSAFNAMRRAQLDWVVDGRDVKYIDVHNLDQWIRDNIKTPAVYPTSSIFL